MKNFLRSPKMAQPVIKFFLIGAFILCAYSCSETLEEELEADFVEVSAIRAKVLTSNDVSVSDNVPENR